MRLLRCLVAFLTLVSAHLVSAQDNYSYYPYVIDDYEVRGTLHKDSSFDVVEVIQVTFNETKHGIFRVIPFAFDTGQGIVRKTVIDKIRVNEPNGQPYTTKITKDGAYVRIRIGDKDIELPPGTKKTYAISYRVQNAVNWFEKDTDWDSHAELYWNMTGNDWDTVIKSFRYRVTFPETSKPSARVFAGYMGSTAATSIMGIGKAKDTSATSTSLELTKSELNGQRVVPLSQGEGVTFVLGVPEDVIARPSVAALTWWAFTANSGFFLPVFVLIVLIPIWLTKGRDPKGKECEVAFEPPDGLSATECGSLLDERVDMRDVSAGLITLAVKGYLTISAGESSLFGSRDITIKLTGKEKDSSLGPFEVLLLKKLKKAKGSIDKTDLTTYVGADIGELQNTAYKTLVDKGYYRIAPNDAKMYGCFGGLGLAFVTAIILHTFFSLGADESSWIIGVILSLFVIGFFSKLIPRRTQKGADIRSQVAGFENAMRGRKDYMEWVADKKIAEAKYEEYLPYAIAFGLVQQWSDTFKEVVTASPSWYSSPYGHDVWSMNTFSNDFSSVTSSIGSASNTPPRTSSSSGSSGFSSGGGFSGGSSGGGFGGGGGGSW